MTDKQTLRNHYLNLRLGLALPAYESMNVRIRDLFFSSVDLADVKTIHVFLPIQKKREPDTWLIIDQLQRDYPQVKISIPKMTADHQLINYYFEDRAQVRENQWHIPEPEDGVLTPTQAIDLVIVPLLVFDKAGHRLGYGKGFYDRFLSTCRTDCKKVGLSFFEPIESIAYEKTDVALTCAITPARSYFF